MRNQKFACKACNKSFPYARSLHRHQKSCKKKEDVDSSSNDEESEYEQVDENVAACQECEMSFASPAGLEVHQQHCNKKARYGDVGTEQAKVKVEGNNNNKSSMRVVEKASRLMPLLLQKDSECSGCGKTFSSDAKLLLHKKLICNKTAADGGEIKNGGESGGKRSFEGERKDLGQSVDVDPKKSLGDGSGVSQVDADSRKTDLENNSNVGKESEVVATKENIDTAIGKGSDVAVVKKVEAKAKPVEDQVTTTRDCPKEKVRMLVDFLSLEGKPFRINLTLPRDCIMQTVMVKVTVVINRNKTYVLFRLLRISRLDLTS